MSEEHDAPSEKLARMADADMAAAVKNADRLFGVIQSAMAPRPSNVHRLPEIDPDDRNYVAEQFDEIVELIERLPRTYRVFMQRDMPLADRAKLVEIAGVLAAMGAKAAPTPKDAA